MMKASGLLIIANDTKRVLLQHRSDDGYWACFGGGNEDGEDIYTAATREVNEETGHKGMIKIYSTFYCNLNKDLNLKYYNLVGKTSDEFTPKLNDESHGFMWIYFEDILSLNLHPGFKKFVLNRNNYIKSKINA